MRIGVHVFLAEDYVCLNLNARYICSPSVIKAMAEH